MAAASTSVRRRLGRRRQAVLAGAVLIGVVLGGCSRGHEPSRADVVSALEDSGVPAAQAECVTDIFLKDLPKADVIRITERGDKGVIDDPANPDEPIDKARAAMAACRDLGVTTTTAEIQETTTTTAPAEVTTTTSPVETTTTAG